MGLTLRPSSADHPCLQPLCAARQTCGVWRIQGRLVVGGVPCSKQCEQLMCARVMLQLVCGMAAQQSLEESAV